MNEEGGPVLVVVRSQLLDETNRSEFLRLSRLTDGWMSQQNGFLRYELYESRSGWFDTMLWRDRAAADIGNAAFATTGLAAAFSKIVKQDFDAFEGAAISFDQSKGIDGPDRK